MSRNAVILERTAADAALFSPPSPAGETPLSGDYLELIRRYFQARSAVAVVAVGTGGSARDVCENLAGELAASGNRVVIFSVDVLLRLNPVTTPEESGCTPGRVPNVWHWPSAGGEQLECFKSRGPADPAGRWLDSLRLSFDSVLLDCPSPESTPAASQLAAMADAVLLVVEAGKTTKQQIRRDQRALQLRGVKLDGCILRQRR